MDNYNGMEFYYAIVNIIDGMVLSGSNLTPEIKSALDIILTESGDNIDDIADANNCKTKDDMTWDDLFNGFKELWEKGERS